MKGLELATEVTGRNLNRTPATKLPCRQLFLTTALSRTSSTTIGAMASVFPAKGDFMEEIDDWNPDGFFFSNGPGDPNAAVVSLDIVN
ncbi:MAG: hypothetical protein U5K69_29690 [Balneolaceae bacterium]|nr:hypothetical protein [Balneolaceae bacterium]